MSKNFIGIMVAVVALGLIGGVYAMNKTDDNKQSSTTTPASHNSSPTPTEQGAQTTPSAPANQQAAGQVDIKDYAFGPQKITIKKGTTVTWTNQDSAKHDVMPDDESDAFKASQLLGKGESYSFTFNTAGTYSYFCSPHPYMKASVEVVE